MIRRMIILLSSLIVPDLYCSPLHGATYFVNNETGDDDNSGIGPYTFFEEDGPLATIQEAANRATQPGDVVYVQRTSTAYAPFTLMASGSPALPIKFIGWNTGCCSWNDLMNGEGIPESYTEITTDGSAYHGKPTASVTASPLISGNHPGSGGPIGINFNNMSCVHVYNFWIKRCSTGIYCNADFCHLEHIYLWDNDQVNIYDGAGITLETCHDNTIQSCVCYNTGQVGFQVISDGYNNVFSDCTCYTDRLNPADNNTNWSVTSPDLFAEVNYYFHIGNSNNNTLFECMAERHVDPIGSNHRATPHGGHGFALQKTDGSIYDCYENNIASCDTSNITEPILVRGLAHNNSVSYVTSSIDGNHDLSTVNRNRGYVSLVGAAYANDFEFLVFTNSDIAVACVGWQLSQNSYLAEASAAGNSFSDCWFDCEVAIKLWDEGDESGAITPHPAGSAYSNTLSDGTVQDVINNMFHGCHFFANVSNLSTRLAGKATFFEVARESYNNVFDSCEVVGFARYKRGSDASVNVPYALGPLFVVPSTGVVIGYTFVGCYLANPSDSVPNGGWPSPAQLGNGNTTP